MLIMKWQDQGTWKDFDCNDINHMSRTHAINLFSNGIPVIIKEGTNYIVNKVDLFQRYKNERKSVTMLSECIPSDKIICDVGFTADL